MNHDRTKGGQSSRERIRISIYTHLPLTPSESDTFHVASVHSVKGHIGKNWSPGKYTSLEVVDALDTIGVTSKAEPNMYLKHHVATKAWKESTA